MLMFSVTNGRWRRSPPPTKVEGGRGRPSPNRATGVTVMEDVGVVVGNDVALDSDVKSEPGVRSERDVKSEPDADSGPDAESDADSGSGTDDDHESDIGYDSDGSGDEEPEGDIDSDNDDIGPLGDLILDLLVILLCRLIQQCDGWVPKNPVLSELGILAHIVKWMGELLSAAVVCGSLQRRPMASRTQGGDALVGLRI